MIDFKTNMKVSFSSERLIQTRNESKEFTTAYSASVKQDVIDIRMRAPGTKFPSRFIDEKMKKDE